MAGGRVVLIQSSTDRLTMQQAIERGGKSSSPPATGQGRTSSPRTKKKDFTDIIETALSQRLPDKNEYFSFPVKTCHWRNQSSEPIRQKSDSDECILPLQNIPQAVTEIKKMYENQEQHLSSKAVVRYATESSCKASSHRGSRAVLPKGSPKLPLKIKSSLNRSRSSSLPVISPVSQLTSQEKKTTCVQPNPHLNKEFLSIKRTDAMSLKTLDNKDCDIYCKEGEIVSEFISESPSNISKSPLSKTAAERGYNKCQTSDYLSEKSECLSEQSKTQSKIPVSITDARWRTQTSRTPKVVQDRSITVMSHFSTENELKVKKGGKSIQQKNLAAPDMKKVKPLNQMDKEAPQILNKRKEICVNVRKSLQGKQDKEEMFSSESLNHSSSLSEEDCELWKEKVLFNPGKLTQYSPKKYIGKIPDITLKSNEDCCNPREDRNC